MPVAGRRRWRDGRRAAAPRGRTHPGAAQRRRRRLTAPPPFRDRRDAGAALAAALRGRQDVVVLGLPRGGVPVAAVVADALGAPLDVVVVRKLGVPSQPELAMGAVGEGGVVVRSEQVLRRAGVDPASFTEVLARERSEVERRVARLRPDRPRAPVAGRTAVVVDDGLATGSTARAACAVLRAAGAARIVLAVPVAPAGVAVDEADELVVVRSPDPFGAVGRWYADFTATSEQEVADLLRR